MAFLASFVDDLGDELHLVLCNPDAVSSVDTVNRSPESLPGGCLHYVIVGVLWVWPCLRHGCLLAVNPA
jgi:hypothetical protein